MLKALNMKTFRPLSPLLFSLLCALSCEGQQQESSGKGHLEVSPTELQVGLVHKAPAVSTYWLNLKNTGKGLLNILDVRTSCYCTTVEWEKKPLKPRKKTRLKVVLDTSDMEPAELFVREIYIKSDADNPDATVTMSGSIKD